MQAKLQFKLIDYVILKAALKIGIVAELKSHGLDPLKLEDSIKLLPPPRDKQVALLRKTIEITDTLDPALRKTRCILNALAYFIRNEIALSYKYAKPERSVLFVALTDALQLNKGMPDTFLLREMYTELAQHLRKNTFTNSQPKKGFLEDSPFKFGDFSFITQTMKDLNVQLQEVRSKELDEALKLEESKKPAPASSGILGMFGLSTKPDPQATDAPKKSSKEAAPSHSPC